MTNRRRLFQILLSMAIMLAAPNADAGRKVRAKTESKAARAAAVESLTTATGLNLNNRSVVYKGRDGKGRYRFNTRKTGQDGKALGTVLISAKTKQGVGVARTNPKGAKSRIKPTAPQFNTLPVSSRLKKAKPLKGKTVVVLVESQFVPQEIDLYKNRFAEYGAKVVFASRLWGQEKLRFHSHIDGDLIPEVKYMDVTTDIGEIDLSSGDIAAVIQPVHSQQRLMYDPGIVNSKNPRKAAKKAPAVDLINRALKDPNVVVGAFGHGVEIMAPLKKTIKGARFTAAAASVTHMVNAGGKYVPPADPENFATHTVTEKSTKRVKGLNLVTGTALHGGGAESFVDAVATRAMEIRDEQRAQPPTDKAQAAQAQKPSKRKKSRK